MNPRTASARPPSVILIGLLLGLAVLWLAGCSSAPTTTANHTLYASHVQRFAQSQPHTVHAIPRADGRVIQAREFNPARKGEGPTLVLMHGFPDNQHLYDELIPQLTPDFHVVSFDFLGWGASEKPPSHVYDVASQVADLDAVVRQLALRRIVPVLHDLSGPSGIDWALDHEDRVEALVLLNTYYSPMPTLVAPEAIQFYATAGVLRDLAVWGASRSTGTFQNGVGSQLARFFSQPAMRDAYLPVITHAAGSMRPAFFSATSVLWREVEDRRAKVPRLQRFGKPVHIIFGQDDPYLNPGVAKSFQGLFPGASLALVAGAGHYVQLDQAGEVGRLVVERLGRPAAAVATQPVSR